MRRPSHWPEILCLAAFTSSLLGAAMSHAGWEVGFAEGERARVAFLIGVSAVSILAGCARLRSLYRAAGVLSAGVCLAGFGAALGLDAAAVYFCVTARFV